MSDISDALAHTPTWQRSIRDKCVHPIGRFIAFKKEDVEQSIPQRFEQQVGQHSHRLAIKSRHHELTYDELNKAANRVAQAILAQRGEGQEPIALLCGHGAPLLAAILGVLKAGKFYVPLDPSYPHARLRYMLEDSQAALIITNNQSRAFAGQLARRACQLINVEELDSSLSDENIGLSLAPDALAYVIYTSGSTAQPKGAVQNHRNVLHKIMMSTNDYHLCADDRRTLLSSPSSSSSVWGIFGALLNGGSLYPFDVGDEGMTNMAKRLIREEITVYVSVPTLFRQLVRTLTGQERFPRLRLVNLGGEAVSKRDVELYKEHFSPDCILATTLAATEAGTFRRYFVDKETQITGSFVPAGYPVEDKEVRLLDDQGNEVGFDRIGEIVVQSHYMSPGYWRKPELTRSKFLPLPEGGDGCVYHTGDLGRMLPDGCLIYMGREDSQVKVRGHRVEIVEIELALRSQDNVEEAVVVYREDEPGDQRLVAYIVPMSPPVPRISALRQALADILPGHMMPSAFVMLAALPLTPAGKIDRRELPKPDRARRELESSFVPPHTPVERTLAEIWAAVLDLERVGIHDNFIELGGHSLLATQIISRVIKTFHVTLPVKALIEAPTVAEMAVVLIQHQVKEAGSGDVERMLAELDALSDEEAKKLLADDGS
jgi:amino acid adenylation domain-containing protein